MLELNKLLTVILMLLLHSHGATLTPATRHCTKHKAQQQYKERELPAVAPSLYFYVAVGLRPREAKRLLAKFDRP